MEYQNSILFLRKIVYQLIFTFKFMKISILDFYSHFFLAFKLSLIIYRKKNPLLLNQNFIQIFNNILYSLYKTLF